MKLGLCVETVFKDLPFPDRIRKAGDLGMRHVEMWLVDASVKGSAADLARVAGQSGVTITNSVVASPAAGGLTDPACRDAWLAQAEATLAFNREAGIGASIVCTGNVVDGMDDEAMLQSVLDGLKPTVDMAEKYGVTLILEPLNTLVDHPGYWLTSSDRGADICRRLASPRMRLLFDCYHMQIMEGNLLAHIERNLDVIGHFHSAGVPGRHELFKSEVHYPFLISAVEEMGYDGVFGLEYMPAMEHEASLAETLRYLGPVAT